MAQVNYFISLLMCLTMFPYYSISDEKKGYVDDACSVTRYRALCVQSLAPFSNAARDNPTLWARAGVSVTLGESKRVARFLSNKNNTSNLRRGRNGVALLDCVECFQSTLDNLHMSLNVLRNLNAREFGSQLDDVTTWTSAALTDEDTCLDGFGGQRGKRVRNLINRVSKASYLTSNALSLVNKLATAGPGFINNDYKLQLQGDKS